MITAETVTKCRQGPVKAGGGRVAVGRSPTGSKSQQSNSSQDLGGADKPTFTQF